MRAEQLYEAIGGVDSRFLFESERRRKGTKGFFATLVAVLLTAVILFGVLSFVLIALRKSDVVDPFSQFNFGLGAQTPAKEPFGIEDTVTSEHGSLYYKAEGDHSVTLVLEKTTDKNLQVYMRFSRSYIKNEDESHTEYGHDRVIFTTDPIVRALNEKATNEGVRIFVNGELCEKLPEKKANMRSFWIMENSFHRITSWIFFVFPPLSKWSITVSSRLLMGIRPVRYGTVTGTMNEVDPILPS